MKAVRLLVVISSLAACLVSAAGCEVQDCSDEEEAQGKCVEAKSVKEFEGDVISKSVPYTPGQLLSIHNVHGEVDVKAGAPGKIVVNFKPFNFRAYDAEAEAREQLALLGAEVTSDANSIFVRTSRPSEAGQLGADIEVLIPEEFNGAMLIENESLGNYGEGDIDVDFVGTSPSIEIDNDSLIGNCFVTGAPTMVNTKVRCNGDTTIAKVSDTVDVQVKGLTNKVQVDLAAVSANAKDSVVASEDGEIIVRFPSTGNFAVTATTKEGAVSDLALPSGCQAGANTPAEKSFTCGSGGPTYLISAGIDGVGDSNVSVLFQ